jgi:sulfoxide reductase catalytic subunit YedY
MLIRSRKPWELSERDVTPEPFYRNRREIIAGAAGLGVLALPGCGKAQETAQETATTAPAGGVGADGALTFAKTEYAVGDPSTPFEAIAGYNNFYEFGTGKDDPARYAHEMTTDPWSVRVDGLCARPGTYGLEDVVDFNALEERIYRHRCVEAWSMVIPWIGVPLSSVLAKYEPTSDAKYVAFETYLNRDEMRGARRPVLEWPYVEGLRLDEAMHPLSLMVVGLYGKVLPNQNGAPLRTHIPWKYGFKSIKSIVRISFTADEPPTAWNKATPREYGFYSNVNPEVPHPRWSQESERVIAGGLLDRRPTEKFNGYGEAVAHLYAGMDLAKFY